MRVFFGTLGLTLVFATAAAAGMPDAARGRGLAIEACSACHQVTARQPRPAPVADPDTAEAVAAPSFAAIGGKFRHDAAGLRAFILAPDHPMREQRFVPRDLDDIVAYIRALGHSPRP
ncbi:MAG: c-type cytochrome [Rhizomicrobium sp.]